MLATDALDRLGEGRHNVLRFAALSQRVATFSRRRAIGQCPFARFGQRDEAGPTQADIATATLHDETQQPAFGAGRVNYEVEAIAVSIAAALFELADLYRSKCLIRVLAPTFNRSSAELSCPTFLAIYRLGCNQIHPDRLGR